MLAGSISGCVGKWLVNRPASWVDRVMDWWIDGWKNVWIFEQTIEEYLIEWWGSFVMDTLFLFGHQDNVPLYSLCWSWIWDPPGFSSWCWDYRHESSYPWGCSCVCVPVCASAHICLHEYEKLWRVQKITLIFQEPSTFLCDIRSVHGLELAWKKEKKPETRASLYTQRYWKKVIFSIQCFMLLRLYAYKIESDYAIELSEEIHTFVVVVVSSQYFKPTKKNCLTYLARPLDLWVVKFNSYWFSILLTFGEAWFNIFEKKTDQSAFAWKLRIC